MTKNVSGRPIDESLDALCKNCEACGKVFWLRERRFQSRARFMRRRFCSTECGSKSAGRPVDRFWSNVKTGSDCWEWRGSLFPNGYGIFYVNDKSVRAHRYSYELHKGTIPKGKMILHSCDNRKCVNPDHLRAGTARDNIMDALERGRAKPPVRYPKGAA